MKTTCPHCGKGFDVAIKTVLQWVLRSEKLRSAIWSMLGRINGRKAPVRKIGTEAARKAANARWDRWSKVKQPE